MKQVFLGVAFAAFSLYGMDNSESINIPPLFVAINENNIEEVERLLENKADLTQLGFDEKSDQKTPPLTWAAERDNVAIAGLLLKAGAKPNLFDDRGRTALHYAVIKRSYKMINLLQDNGGDPHIKGDENDMTPYEWLKMYDLLRCQQVGN